MVADDVIGVGRWVVKNTHIPTGIKEELVISGVSCELKDKLSGLLEEKLRPFILVDKLFLLTFSSYSTPLYL